MATKEEERLTRAQYRALKNKIDHADKSVKNEAQKIADNNQTKQNASKQTDRDIRHQTNATYDQVSKDHETTQLFKREEDLDAPRKFSASFLNEAIAEKETKQAKVGPEQNPSRQEPERTSQEASTEKPSFQERLFGKGKSNTAQSNVENEVDNSATVETEEASRESKPLFGPTKIDRFLNIAIILLTIGIIILTVIAFYF